MLNSKAIDESFSMKARWMAQLELTRLPSAVMPLNCCRNRLNHRTQSYGGTHDPPSLLLFVVELDTMTRLLGLPFSNGVSLSL